MPARTLVALAIALVAIALAAAACGGGDDTETTTDAAPAQPPSGSAAPPSGNAAPPSLSAFPPEFVDCLADQGIDVESVTDVSAVIHSPEGEQCFGVLHGG